MAATYYVTHPNFELSALVSAPSTDKARTAFLDWLERNEYIQRADRQYWRRDMIAHRAEDPVNISADTVLHYDYEDDGDYSLATTPRPAPVPTPRQADRHIPAKDLDEDWWADARVVDVEDPTTGQHYPPGADIPLATPEPVPVKKLSPIQKVSLGMK
jgi:hypothetical protein